MKILNAIQSWHVLKKRGLQRNGLQPTILCKTCASLHAHINRELPARPDKHIYEPLWYRYWENERLFSAEAEVGDGKSFSMLLPPPNVTGNLHLGHALTVAVQDALYRYSRMTKKFGQCVWVPGYDHAGISTQLILDKQLYASRGKRAHDLSADEFEAFANHWRDNRISDIRQQLKRLGASLDFSREYFTMDNKLSKAVQEAFIRLYNKGLIYRTKSIVNWSYFLQSAISDIEIEWTWVNKPQKLKVPGFNEDVEFGVLHKFAYPLDGSTEIVVGTTRVETMPADVAVAVHPGDSRYSHLIGREFAHPLTNSKLTIIGDERVVLDFCTGAVKITPSYSKTDYDIGHDHRLEHKVIFDDKGFVTDDDLRPSYQNLLNGLHRYAAKEKIIGILQECGLYRGSIPHKTRIPVCSRSGDVVEQRVVPQWFLNLRTAAQEVKNLIENEAIHVEPKSQASKIIKWIDEERDWCISRQIQWGHRIPVYKAESGPDFLGHIVAGSQEEAMKIAREKYGLSQNIELNMEKDVLDTWFSSALLPFTAFGWPSESKDYKKFYPLSLMETGHDILNFWVLRMLLLGKSLTGSLPFRKIVLHGMVCDVYGKKMSKSVGNVIDPNDVIEGVTLDQLKETSQRYKDAGILSDSQLAVALKNQEHLFPDGVAACGADALRMSLYQSKDRTNECIKLDVVTIVKNRNYTNKMWQAFNFYSLFLKSKPHNHEWAFDCDQLHSLHPRLSLMDRWILSCLSSFVRSCHQNLHEYDFEAVHAAITKFWIESFCDFYLESLKIILYADVQDTDAISASLNVLTVCLKTCFIAIHPFMPFITEELFQRLRTLVSPETNIRSIIHEQYPSPELWSRWTDRKVEEEMELFQLLVRHLRVVKVDYASSPEEEKQLQVNLFASNKICESLEKLAQYLPKFTRAQVFIKCNDESSGQYPISIQVNPEVIMTVNQGANVLSKKLCHLDEKIVKARSRLDVCRSKPVSKKLQRKMKELEKALSELQVEKDKLEALRARAV